MFVYYRLNSTNYEDWTRFLNGMSVFDMYQILTCPRHRYITVYKKDKSDFLKIQTYCISFYYDYNKKQILYIIRNI